MNQRDQSRYGQRPEQGPRGQRQGRYGAMPETGTGQRPSRSRFFTDTYNPEPQWLREDEAGRRYGQPLGRDFDRGDEDYRSGRQAMAGRERGYGDEEPGRHGERHDRQFGARRQDVGEMRSGPAYYGEDYGRERGYGQRMMAAGWDEDHPGPGQYQGGYGDYGNRFEEGRGGYGPSPYGASGYGAEYGSRGQRSRSGRQFASDYGAGGYDQVSGRHGYRSRGGYATGDYQSGLEGQPSYRGFGPQGYKRSDDRIRDDVCERLTDDPGIDASNITIDVNQGAVTLSGSVPERHMRYAAEDLVDDAMGVESINNQLRVQSRSEMGTMASGSRATAPSEMEKQKH